jgi:uncharacterized membrane protein SirB2
MRRCGGAMIVPEMKNDLEERVMSTGTNGIVSIILLLSGIALSTVLHNLGETEWALLFAFILLGLVVGIYHGIANVRYKQGKISGKIRKLRVILSLFALFVIKGMLTGSIPSHLESRIGMSLIVQILFSIAGLFIGRLVVSIVYRQQREKLLQ